MVQYKQLFFVAFLLISSLMVVGCGGSGGGNFLKLTDIDPSLSDCQKEKDMPRPALDVVTDSVEFAKVDLEKYDKLFMQAAIINGTMREMKHVIVSVKNDPKMFVRSSINGKCTIALVQYGTQAIPKLIESAKSIIEQLKALTPADDFTGLKATKVPAAAKGIAESVQNLTAAAQELSSILTELDVVSKTL